MKIDKQYIDSLRAVLYNHVQIMGVGVEMSDEWKQQQFELLAQIRKNMPNKIAEDLVSVQPMDGKAFKDVLDHADKRTEEELKADGYEPVSSHKLMWIKKDKNENN